MKIIQSFLLLAVCLCITALVHAQEVKTQVLKPAEVKPTAASTVSNNPSPAPAALSQTPSPFKQDQALKPVPVAAVPITEVAPPIIQTQMQPAHLRQQKN